MAITRAHALPAGTGAQRGGWQRVAAAKVSNTRSRSALPRSGALIATASAKSGTQAVPDARPGQVGVAVRDVPCEGHGGALVLQAFHLSLKDVVALCDTQLPCGDCVVMGPRSSLTRCCKPDARRSCGPAPAPSEHSGRTLVRCYPHACTDVCTFGRRGLRVALGDADVQAAREGPSDAAPAPARRALLLGGGLLLLLPALQAGSANAAVSKVRRLLV